MDRKLFTQALTKFSAGLLAFGVLLFLPAGTFRYPQGWLPLIVFWEVSAFASMYVIYAKHDSNLQEHHSDIF